MIQNMTQIERIDDKFTMLRMRSLRMTKFIWKREWSGMLVNLEEVVITVEEKQQDQQKNINEQMKNISRKTYRNKEKINE